MFKTAIIGRPNVGKSTLFNRLAKKDAAIVFDTAGTTRDVKEYEVDAGDGFSFLLSDTAGLEERAKDSLSQRMTAKTLAVLKSVDIIIFAVDAKAGITLEDAYFANKIRRAGKRVILVANKAENMRDFNAALGDLAGLGFGEAIPISAAHNQGIGELMLAIKREIVKMQKLANMPDGVQPECGEPLSESEISDIIKAEEEMSEVHDLSVRLAIIGRPNVGKSTLVNTLLGEEKMLTGDEAGITRDAIDTDFIYRGREVKLIDTAGMRRRAKVYNGLEKFSVAKSIESIRNCDVCALVFDASAGGADKQDLAIANVAIREGKGLLFAANKIDLTTDKKARLASIRDQLAASFAQVKNVPLVGISATKGTGVRELMAAAFELYDMRIQRITTGKLNKWLEGTVAKNPPPMSRLKRPMSIKYITQSAVKPPTFTLFVGGASELPESYKRYLVNSLSESFVFDKIAVRLHIKSSANPYKERK
ncbi:MAG: ribosome biogenesis GTPase Der [Rickettsiales bacterium]|jgi:GTP-binding protein|nr:ribosome biogenesis GTPase Der [Rickettsiales bacterium]